MLGRTRLVYCESAMLGVTRSEGFDTSGAKEVTVAVGDSVEASEVEAVNGDIG